MINNILHRNAGWTHATKSFMQYGLPKLAKPRNPDDAFERIGALVLLAKDIAHWMQNFARSMHEYMQTPTYQKERQSSMLALEKRRKKG